MEINKKRIVLSVVLSLICAATVSLACFMLTVSNVTKRNNAVGIYEQTQFDFIVRGASAVQQSGFNNTVGAQSVTGAYSFTLLLKSGSISEKSSVNFVDSVDALEQTTFTKARQLRAGVVQSANPLFIDEKLTAKGIKLGDSVTAQMGDPAVTVTFTVDGIYKNDTTSSGGSVFALWQGAQKEAMEKLYELKPHKLFRDVCYVSASNGELFREVLKDYKPLGEKPNRVDYDNDASFEGALAAFERGDYAGRIFDTAEHYATADGETKGLMSQISVFSVIGIIIGFVIIGGGSLIHFFINKASLIDSIRRASIRRKAAYRNEGKSLAIEGGLSLVFTAIGLTVVLLSSKLGFALISAQPLALILPLFGGVFGALLAFGVKMLFIKNAV